MILFFETPSKSVYAVQSHTALNAEELGKLSWVFGDAQFIDQPQLDQNFVGPRKEMITPASTNAVEITQNMGIKSITRIEEFFPVPHKDISYDHMLFSLYKKLDSQVFDLDTTRQAILPIDDVAAYNREQALALSDEEVQYLEGLAKNLGRKLTDSEIFGFAQVNSEHCRHKIFNGTFIINGEEKQSSLFQLIKKTSKQNPNTIVSAYKDNCSFTEGSKAMQFAPASADQPDYFQVKEIDTVLSLKAETHNFPTTVEPFNGAATGTGGEIRDRMAGGKASVPMAGTAVYMTAYPRLGNKAHEQTIEARKWLYQSPQDILIKASNGASDFGNKFGQPLINGSLLTFEHAENQQVQAYDKVIMLAGGIGYAKKEDALKETPKAGQDVVLVGGDNYRIGIGGGAVSSVATGEYDNSVELNAVQRSNPEMQKRAFNLIRAFSEADQNPVVSIHDHGAGGHLNCFSELVEDTGGEIHIDKLPIGDATLSDKEIVGNESQERIGFVVEDAAMPLIQRVAERERAPLYQVGKTTDDHRFSFVNTAENTKAIDLSLKDFFGNPPKTVIEDTSQQANYEELSYHVFQLASYVEAVLQVESVACKDWLTNKVDRSVTGKVAHQQTVGSVQVPLANLGAVALDYKGEKGIASTIGHAPTAALLNAAAGSKLAIAEALTNMVFAPLTHGVKGVSLSANWMWPCGNPGEGARLYEAVEAASEFACELGINIPTGKDSLSMTQKYPDGQQVMSPGTVIISASAEVADVKKIVAPNLVCTAPPKDLLYVDFAGSDFALGGSVFAQTQNRLGTQALEVDNAYFKKAFTAVQELVQEQKVVAGHDVSEGGLISCLLEMCFADNQSGMDCDFSVFPEKDLVNILFSEKPAVVLQADMSVLERLQKQGIKAYRIGTVNDERRFGFIGTTHDVHDFDINKLRDKWFETSYQLDKLQSTEKLAAQRLLNYKSQELQFNFTDFTPDPQPELDRSYATGLKAAIIREKGSNGEREMAYAMHLAGFDVKDVHMTDLMSGRETLEDIRMVVFVGGFSNSDVLGSAKGWAAAFKYNANANQALQNFYARPDTLSLGVCNGCQLMAELDLIEGVRAKMEHNDSGKFESSFVSVKVPTSPAVMLKGFEGRELGIWVAHGEGKFNLEAETNIALRYAHAEYPGNPNGSDYHAAGVCSTDGRHLAMMPHFERAIFPWQWAHYPQDRKSDALSPWAQVFENARKWMEAERSSASV